MVADPTKKAPCVAPIANRATYSSGSVAASACPATVKAVSAVPPTMMNRRPRVSPRRPTIGLATIAETENMPSASPTATFPPPSSFST